MFTTKQRYTMSASLVMGTDVPGLVKKINKTTCKQISGFRITLTKAGDFYTTPKVLQNNLEAINPIIVSSDLIGCTKVFRKKDLEEIIPSSDFDTVYFIIGDSTYYDFFMDYENIITINEVCASFANGKFHIKKQEIYQGFHEDMPLHLDKLYSKTINFIQEAKQSMKKFTPPIKHWVGNGISNGLH